MLNDRLLFPALIFVKWFLCKGLFETNLNILWLNTKQTWFHLYQLRMWTNAPFWGRGVNNCGFFPILPINKPGPRLSKTDSVVGPLWGITKIKTHNKIVWIYHLLKWTNEKTAKPFWSFVDCWCVISHADEPVDNRASTPPASAVERR